MPQTVEVRFKGIRRDFYTWPDDGDPLRLREAVVVEAERGRDLGRVNSIGEVALSKCGSCRSCSTSPGPAPVVAGAATSPPADSADEPEAPAGQAGAAPPADPPDPSPDGAESLEQPAASSQAELKRVLRRASTDDLRQANELRRSEEDTRRQAADRARLHRLDLKVSDTEWQWDRNKLTVYFTAEKRVDFRTLVRDLAARFRTRIELRQIGVRDEAARLGGVGRCGRTYCCSTWLGTLSPVSLALAKDQHLSLNPAQISGGCGRLLCCLKYEHDFYVAARSRFPREGKSLETTRGSERVIAVDIFRERVFLRSEEHGSRIVGLSELKAELGQETEGLIGPPAHPRVEPPPGPPPLSPSRAIPEGAAGAAPAPPPVGPPAEDGADHPSPRSRRRRRRRRGRGGREGSGGEPGPTSPPPSPGA
jgi:cell fate regulator YaaT (PSP1 superfamily)